MFEHLFPLVLILLLTEMAEKNVVLNSPIKTGLWALGLYLLLCFILRALPRVKLLRHSFLSKRAWAQCLILSYFCLYFFILKAQGLFSFFYPLLQTNFFIAVFILSLYFLAIALFQYSQQTRSSYSKETRHYTYHLITQQFRFTVPFVLPFLLFTLIVDTLELFQWDLAFKETSVFGLLVGFLIMTMIVFPYLLQKIWDCRPLEDVELAARLESVCQRAHFRHAGIKTWGVLNESTTAAIIGLIPRLRYVIFTKRLLKKFPPDAIEAVLIHEIGHSYYKHLWLYPLLVLGLIETLAIGHVFIFESFATKYIVSNTVQLIFLFSLYAFLLVFYIRIVIGFFSRQFERQADLYALNLHQSLDSMVKALDLVGIEGGYIHDVPNWHHFSLSERIVFLQAVQKRPQLAKKHHQFVKWCLIAYFMCLLIGTWFLLF